MQSAAGVSSVVSSTLPARRRLISNVRPKSRSHTMRIAVSVVCLVAVIACFAQADDEATIHKQLGAVKDRMKIERKDYGEDGTIFKVWITPPEKPSYDEDKYTGLSEFARALDVPCKKVEIGLNSLHARSGLTSVVRHTFCNVWSFVLARLTFSRMSLAEAVQMKGFGAAL
jgi:hypothetical protein